MSDDKQQMTNQPEIGLPPELSIHCDRDGNFSPAVLGLEAPATTFVHVELSKSGILKFFIGSSLT